MNKSLRGLIIISVNLVILMIIGTLWLYSIKEQRVVKPESISINIYTHDSKEKLISTKDILTLVNSFYNMDFREIPVYNLNLRMLEEFIISQALVKRADIYIDGKNILHLDVYQRTPLIRVIDVSENQYYLDEEGYKIPVSNKYSARVLVATGQLASIQGVRMKPTEKLYYAPLIHVALAIRKDSFVRSLIEQIDMDQNGEYTLIPKVGNEKIFLGGADMIDDKLDRLKLFYKENMGRQGWNVYKLVNLKFKGQVIGRKVQQES